MCLVSFFNSRVARGIVSPTPRLKILIKISGSATPHPLFFPLYLSRMRKRVYAFSRVRTCFVWRDNIVVCEENGKGERGKKIIKSECRRWERASECVQRGQLIPSLIKRKRRLQGDPRAGETHQGAKDSFCGISNCMWPVFNRY